jgi:formylglycine-generating enzyme required for sulfatase activity
LGGLLKLDSSNSKNLGNIMRNYIFTALLLLGIIVLFEGCSRKAPNEKSSESKSESETKIESGNSMVLLPGGTFIMGYEDEIDSPPHEVTVSAFYIDTHLVTQEQYEKLMGENPSRWKGKTNPVEQMRWSDAVKYCNARSEAEGIEPCYDLNTWKCDFTANGYRLPTEAEWEYACRAGTTTAYSFGDDVSKLKAYAWFEDNSGGKPRPVGQKAANPWGLYDMHGNVWEWCNDFYKVDYYQEGPKENPRGPQTGEAKVLRGGAWKFSAETCRSGYRYNENPGYADVCFGYDIYGFRCVRNAGAAAEPQ